VPFEARVEAQGTGDLTLSLCGASAAFASGFDSQSAGFHVLANSAPAVAAGRRLFAGLPLARLRKVGLQPAA
jgi:hypothetical protein